MDKKLLIIECHKCGQRHPYNFINKSNKYVGEKCSTTLGINPSQPKGWIYCQAILKQNYIKPLNGG